MPRPKKVAVKDEAEEIIASLPKESEKEHLLELYQELKDRNIRSISDLEGQIARASD